MDAKSASWATIEVRATKENIFVDISVAPVFSIIHLKKE
jgi:hypothetical protein